MEEARQQGNEIIKNHEAALEKVLETHRLEAMRQSQLRIRAEQFSAKRQVKTAVSKRQLTLKRELGQVKTQLKAELFIEVREILDEYMKEEAYKDQLLSYMEKVVKYAGGQPVTIYLGPGDEDKKEYLEKKSGLTLTVSEEDFIGGIKAIIPSRNILMDYSFLSALEKEQEEFVFGRRQNSQTESTDEKKTVSEKKEQSSKGGGSRG